MVRHLGLPSSVTNGEDDRSRTSVSAEEQLAPAFEGFGFGGPDGHGPWNEPEWSGSMLNGSDGTDKSAGPMIPTTSNNSSGGANPTTMSLQIFVQAGSWIPSRPSPTTRSVAARLRKLSTRPRTPRAAIPPRVSFLTKKIPNHVLTETESPKPGASAPRCK
jgi:hypothetical protein